VSISYNSRKLAPTYENIYAFQFYQLITITACSVVMLVYLVWHLCQTREISYAIGAMVACAVLYKTLFDTIDAIVFQREGAYISLGPDGVRFREGWWSPRTVSWGALREFPNPLEFRYCDPSGVEKIARPRKGFGYLDDRRYCDVVMHYRPDLAADLFRERLRDLNERNGIVDMAAVDALIDDAPDVTVVSRCLSIDRASRTQTESTVVCPDGVITQGTFFLPTANTFPWASFTDITFLDDQKKMLGPIMILWRKPHSIDQAKIVRLDGIADLDRFAATVFKHRPDLNFVRDARRRIAECEARMSEGF
jgi:hypothetical protein